MSRPLQNLADFTPATFMPAVDRLLADPGAVLAVDVDDLLRLSDISQLNHRIDKHFERYEADNAAYATDYLGKVIASANPLVLIATIGSHLYKKRSYRGKRNPVVALLNAFEVRRPVLSLTDQEKGLLRGAAQLTLEQRYSPEQWSRHLALMTWNDGNANLQPMSARADSPQALEAKEILREHLRMQLPGHAAFLSEVAADVGAALRAPPAAPSPTLQAALSPGARWMSPQDLAASPTFGGTPNPASLIVGYEPRTGEPVRFSGHESLITIGGPGSGKSQAHVVHNLLRYAGSAIVLDVKGELWRMTAGYRQKHFGPVYRFAPTDTPGTGHRYNLFDFISRDPSTAASDCSLFAYQIMQENPALTDPYWENRGREILWAYALMVALKARERSIKTLAETFAIPLDKKATADIHQLTESMVRNGERHGIVDLVSIGRAIKSGIGSPRLESVFDTARAKLAAFARNPAITHALSHSDWRPDTFRQRPGSTLYLCLSPDELAAYGGIVRTLLMQHVNAFMKYSAKPDDLPITLFLDELPQLGNFSSILQLQDVGRGAGVRLWMFAQYVGQLSKAFGHDRYKGIIDACRVRCFMKPDLEMSQMLQQALGETRNPLHGTKEPLATVSDLMGKAYGDKIVVTASGDHPMSLDKRMSYAVDRDRFLAPPLL